MRLGRKVWMLRHHRFEALKNGLGGRSLGHLAGQLHEFVVCGFRIAGGNGASESGCDRLYMSAESATERSADDARTLGTNPPLESFRCPRRLGSEPSFT